MHDFSATLLMFALWAYVVGMAGALLFQRAERWANAIGFGLAAAGGACGLVSCAAALATGAAAASPSVELFPSLIP